MTAQEFASSLRILAPHWASLECDSNPHDMGMSRGGADNFQFVDLYKVKLDRCQDFLAPDLSKSPLLSKDGDHLLIPAHPFNESPDAVPWSNGDQKPIGKKMLVHLTASRSMVIFNGQGEPQFSFKVPTDHLYPGEAGSHESKLRLVSPKWSIAGERDNVISSCDVKHMPDLHSIMVDDKKERLVELRPLELLINEDKTVQPSQVLY